MNPFAFIISSRIIYIQRCFHLITHSTKGYYSSVVNLSGNEQLSIFTFQFRFMASVYLLTRTWPTFLPSMVNFSFKGNDSTWLEESLVTDWGATILPNRYVLPLASWRFLFNLEWPNFIDGFFHSTEGCIPFNRGLHPVRPRATFHSTEGCLQFDPGLP